MAAGGLPLAHVPACMRMSRQPLSLKARAVALLAQREHSALELRRKLLGIARERDRKLEQAAASASAGAFPEASAPAHASTSAAASAHPAMSALTARGRRHRDSMPPADQEGAAEPLDVDQRSDPIEEVEQVLTWLRANGYLDESRFVESRLHARSTRWGQRRIEQELSQHGLSLDAQQRAELSSTEFDRALAQLHRKFGEARDRSAVMARGDVIGDVIGNRWQNDVDEPSRVDEADADIADRGDRGDRGDRHAQRKALAAEEARLMRFLLGRGFSTEVARRALRAYRAG